MEAQSTQNQWTNDVGSHLEKNVENVPNISDFLTFQQADVLKT